MHTSGVPAPTESLKLPAGHAMQAVAPVWSVYLPAAHVVQADAPSGVAL